MRLKIRPAINTICVVLLLNNINCQIPSYLPTNGLVAWYPFNLNANDESGNGNDGVINGPIPVEDRFNSANSAYLFNGTSDYIVVDNNATLNNDYLSISLWYKTDNTANQLLVYKTDLNTAMNESYGLSLNLPNGANLIEGAVKNGNNCSNPGQGWVKVNYPYTSSTNEWINIMFTYDGTNEKLYLDGSLVAEVIQPTSVIDNCSGDLHFGISWGLDRFFNGSMDDIAIWNRALTEEEVTNIYSGSIVNPISSNVGINQVAPQRDLHINNILRLEPRDTEPNNPSKGDIYFSSATNKLRVYDGTQWQDCW